MGVLARNAVTLSRLARQLRLGCRVALVGGFVLGTREGFATLHANAFVQPAQYLFGYLSAPLLAWIVLSLLLTLPCAAIFSVACRSSEAHRSLPLYGGLLAFAGTASAIGPSVIEVQERLRAVGVDPGVIAQLILWLLAAGLTTGVAVLVAAATAWCRERVERPLRYAARSVPKVGRPKTPAIPEYWRPA